MPLTGGRAGVRWCRGGMVRVAIVDLDLRHGGGTEEWVRSVCPVNPTPYTEEWVRSVCPVNPKPYTLHPKP